MFAANLKSEIDRLGLTQAEAAALLEISPRTLWSWLQGKVMPSKIEQVGALAILIKNKAKK